MVQELTKINKLIVRNQEKFLCMPEAPKKFKNNCIKKGLFNGLVLTCSDYTIDKGTLSLNCYKARFFDVIYNKKQTSRLISVNAIIMLKEGVLLIKRTGKVHSHKNFWDFPAGFVPYSNSCRSRLQNRIINDTKLQKRHFIMKQNPSFVIVQNYALHLFYLGHARKKTKVNQNKTLLIVPREKFNKFLATHKVVFKEIFNHI